MNSPRVPQLGVTPLPPATVEALNELRRGILRAGEEMGKAMRPVTAALARLDQDREPDVRARALEARRSRGTGPARIIGRRDYR